MDRPDSRRLASALIASHHAVGVSVDGLAEVLETLTLDRLPTGTTLYEQGAPSDELKVLARGAVRVEVGSPDNVVATVEAPAILGHLGVLTGLPRSATVRAAGEVSIGTLDTSALWTLINDEGAAGTALRRLLLASMAGLLATTNRRVIAQLAQSDAPAASPAVAAPKATPRSPTHRSRLAAAGESDDWGFDSDLLKAADEVQIVQAKADRERSYKRRS
ncbi:MAG: cyclic nucleotide-binding domain-containing protein [Deltaproteobacteria bacterium]|nr:MAG: cyclic nucleotide-binding domain-containing protein [Deltaproteobacteria bacterium]